MTNDPRYRPCDEIDLALALRGHKSDYLKDVWSKQGSRPKHGMTSDDLKNVGLFSRCFL